MSNEEEQKTLAVGEQSTESLVDSQPPSTTTSDSEAKPKKQQKKQKAKKGPKGQKAPVIVKKLKILCLHGYAQNLKVFQKRTAVLKKALKSVAELYYVAAPFYTTIDPGNHEKIVIEEGTPEDEKPLAWWNFSEKDDTCIGLEESLDLLLKTMKEQGPFDGILGFSQGSSMAAVLCSHLELEKEKGNPDLPALPRFVMFFSGFRPDAVTYDKYFDVNRKLKIKSLHVYGEEDHWLNPERSKKLITFFENPDVLPHNGGHFIPMEAEKRHFYVDYIKQYLETSESK